MDDLTKDVNDHAGAESVWNAGLGMTPCQEIIGSKQIGGSSELPLIAVYFCQFYSGHKGCHSTMPNV